MIVTAIHGADCSVPDSPKSPQSSPKPQSSLNPQDREIIEIWLKKERDKILDACSLAFYSPTGRTLDYTSRFGVWEYDEIAKDAAELLEPYSDRKNEGTLEQRSCYNEHFEQIEKQVSRIKEIAGQRHFYFSEIIGSLRSFLGDHEFGRAIRSLRDGSSQGLEEFLGGFIGNKSCLERLRFKMNKIHGELCAQKMDLVAPVVYKVKEIAERKNLGKVNVPYLFEGRELHFDCTRETELKQFCSLRGLYDQYADIVDLSELYFRKFLASIQYVQDIIGPVANFAEEALTP